MFTIKIQGVENARAELAALARKSSNFREPLSAFAVHTKGIAARSVKEQADPVSGSPWPRISGLTVGNRRGSGGGAKALYDTGRLVQSFLGARAKVTNKDFTLGSAIPYALIHQTGGTIRPVRAKFLTIPLNKTAALAAKRAGSVRGWWAENRLKLRPFIKRSKGGSLIVFVRKGKKRTIEPWFLLSKQVTIPARPYLGFRRSDHELLLGLLKAHLESPG